MAEEKPRIVNLAARRRSLDDRLKAQARRLEPPTTVANLRRRYVQHRFLARVFAHPDAPWALKGGLGMLVRIPPRARYSRDVDLLHLPADPEQAVQELRRIATIDMGDGLRFQVGPAKRASTDHGLTVFVEVYLGATVWDGFPVDVSCETHFVGSLEPQTFAPVLPEGESDVLGPTVKLYPIVDQVADKVAAMYERHGADGSVASNRWRDLADLVLLVELDGLNADQLRRALEVRVDNARSTVKLPTSMVAPGPEWAAGYPRYAAAETLLHREHHDLTAALEYVGHCLNPVLAGTAVGSWNAVERHWIVG